MTNIYAKKHNQLTKIIGAHIAKIRKDKGFTQESLSQATKYTVNINTISVLERGLGDPKVSTLYQLALAMDTSLANLLDFIIKLDSTPTQKENLIDNITQTLKNLDEKTLEIIKNQIQVLIDAK